MVVCNQPYSLNQSRTVNEMGIHVNKSPVILCGWEVKAHSTCELHTIHVDGKQYLSVL